MVDSDLLEQVKLTDLDDRFPTSAIPGIVLFDDVRMICDPPDLITRVTFFATVPFLTARRLFIVICFS